MSFSFPSFSTFARACLVGGASAIVVTAAWAAPSDSEPQLIEQAAASEAPAAPKVDLPAVGEASQEAAPATTAAPAPAAAAPTDTAAVQAVPTTAAPAVASGTAPVDTAPPHLDPEPVDDIEPVIVSTTTTPPPTTVPPTTTAAPAPKPAPTTTTAPDVTVAFSASQKYGSCGEAVPYDIFSGTATPGSTITITSPYGSGTTTVDAHGHWSRKVEFPGAPANETFSVSVSGLGGSKNFSFTATGEAHA